MGGILRLKGANSGSVDFRAPDSGGNVVIEAEKILRKDSSDIFTLTGPLRGPSTFTIDPATHGDSTGTVRILGGLTVEGTTTTINSQTVTTADKNIVIAQGAADSAATDGAGITIDTVDASLTYSTNDNRWEFDRHLFVNTNTENEQYGPASGGSWGIAINDNAIDSDSICSLKFNSADAGGTNRHFASIAAQKTGQWADGGGNYPGALTFWTRPTSGNQEERMRIDKDGNVGIGKVPETDHISVVTVLEVGNSASLWDYNSGTNRQVGLMHNLRYNSSSQFVASNGDSAGYAMLRTVPSASGTPYLQFFQGVATAADSALTLGDAMFGVDSSGTVCARRGIAVGTTSDASAYRTRNYSGLTMRGGTSDGILGVQDGNGRMQLKWNATNGTAEKYLVSSENAFFWDMTITSSPIWEMKYAGAGTADSAISWTVLLDLTSSGDLEATGDMIAYSDERLKENIEIIPNALEKIEAIDGVTFTRKDESEDFIGRRRAGVIAQQVEKVLPEVVTENKEGTKQVAYGNMVGLLVEAIKELKAEIEELKK